MKITFLLPLSGDRPVGGFKVAYEYANFLAANGHDVSVVHPALLRVDEPLLSHGIRGAIRILRDYWKRKRHGSFKPTSWFKMRPDVKLLWVLSLKESNIPKSDVVIATAWETAEWLAGYKIPERAKFYLIQHLETWNGDEERVMATWKLPLKKIVIAGWLQDLANSLGEVSTLIPNGFDFERFSRDTPAEDRDPRTILMLYHLFDWKGSADGLAAFRIAQQQEPGLLLSLFGVGEPPAEMPAGAVYFRNATQETLRVLYNENAIFIAPSWAEGFPLPPAEAMQCGAAIVATDCGGHRAYMADGVTALMSPIKDPQALAANLLRLIRDRELRLKIANGGCQYIQDFTWERAGRAFEAVLETAKAR